MTTPTALPDWPTVPACYGWLALDRRGAWRLRGEVITHPGLIAFLNANYEGDAGGRWLVNNGPQRVYVELACTPWVIRLGPDDSLVMHTGQAAGEPAAVHVDDEGKVLLATARGLGLLVDRDLAAFLAGCRLADGSLADDEALLALMAGDGSVFWRGLPVSPVAHDALATRYGFDPAPSE